MKKYKFLFVVAFAMFIMLPFKVSAMEIYVKKLTGDNITLEVESSDTIKSVKEKIYQVDNTYPPENQKLLYGGVELENGRRLADYSVIRESTIWLYYTLKPTNVKFNLENLNVTTDNVTTDGNLGNNNFIVIGTKDFTAKLDRLDGYKLPNSISVKINDNLIDVEKYSYNFETGEIFISKDLIDGDIEIDASAVKVYKVVFDANGGTFKNDVKTINIEDIINFDYETFEKPTRENYMFIGFYTEDNKSFDDVMNSEAGIEEDTTFYAKWQEVSAGGGQPGIPEEENPKTFDGIGTSIFMGTISLIGLVGATIYLKKRNKVRV